MNSNTMDSGLVLSWLTGRSVARGLPMPVPDHGGFRVDARSDTEICRWVFPNPCEGLRTLGQSITSPYYFLKLCGIGQDLGAALPPAWRLQPPGYFMAAAQSLHTETKPLRPGYELISRVEGATTSVQIMAPDGTLAASGHAAETANAFVYDRIWTAPDHRRLGLGNAVMQALALTRKQPGIPELLVATDDGRKLYSALGWRILSPYFTATIPVG